MTRKTREAVQAALNHLENVLFTKDGRVHFSDIVRVGNARALLDEALAEPERNCDVGTEQEQQDRFREFCRHYESDGECGIGRSEAACPAFQGGRNPDCSLWWAQMPYETEEGEAK